MAAVVKVRDLVLGEGVPKICVPLTGKTTEALLKEIRQLHISGADMAEWRVDAFEATESVDQVLSAAQLLRDALGDLPLLFTYRSAREGGAGHFSPAEYVNLYRHAARSGAVDMIDLELSAGERICRQVVEICQENGIAILFSSHDFDHTPPAEEMMRRFELMSAWGADIAKLAVMPQTAEDVLALMKTGWQASARMAERCPIVAISMGKLGAISRVSGRVFGSCMTFATVQNASAPGQLSVEAIRSMLAIL